MPIRGTEPSRPQLALSRVPLGSGLLGVTLRADSSEVVFGVVIASLDVINLGGELRAVRSLDLTLESVSS